MYLTSCHPHVAPTPCTPHPPQGTKVNSKGKEVPHGVRLYSIASSRYGDFFDGKSTTLCVRRAVYNDPETGNEDPAKKGICSNFLCDAKPGDEIMMTGACPVLNPVLTAAQQLCPTVLDM
jgi:hypothetical protein